MKRSDLTELHTPWYVQKFQLFHFDICSYFTARKWNHISAPSLSLSLSSLSHILFLTLFFTPFFSWGNHRRTHIRSWSIYCWLAGSHHRHARRLRRLSLSHTHTPASISSSSSLLYNQKHFFLCLCIFFTSCPERVLRIRTSLSLSRSLTQTDRRNRYRKTFFAITLVENHVLRVVGSNPTTAYWMDEFLHTGWTIFRMYLVLKIVITLFEKTKIKEKRLGKQLVVPKN